MNELYHAKYFLCLADAKVNESVRLNFSSCIDYSNLVACNNIFSLIISTVVDGIKIGIYTENSAKLAIEEEFSKLGLEIICGNYSQFKHFINLVVNSCAISNFNVQDFIGMYKSFIEIADNMDMCYKIDIYYAILNSIVNFSHILVDIELTEKLVNYIESLDDVKIGSF